MEGVRASRRGDSHELRLWHLEHIRRDWVGLLSMCWHAPDVQAEPKDYLLHRVFTTSLREFCTPALLPAGLDVETYLISDATFLRPSDLSTLPWIS